MDNRITPVGVSLSILAPIYGVGKRAFLRTAFNYVGDFYDDDNCTRLRMSMSNEKNEKKKDEKMKIKKRLELQRYATDSCLKIRL